MVRGSERDFVGLVVTFGKKDDNSWAEYGESPHLCAAGHLRELSFEEEASEAPRRQSRLDEIRQLVGQDECQDLTEDANRNITTGSETIKERDRNIHETKAEAETASNTSKHFSDFRDSQIAQGVRQAIQREEELTTKLADLESKFNAFTDRYQKLASQRADARQFIHRHQTERRCGKCCTC